MSYLFPPSSQINRTTGLPSSTSYTACGWCKWTTGADTNQFYVNDAGAVNFQGFSSTVANRTFIWGPAFVQFARTAELNKWFFWAVQCRGTGAADFRGWFSYYGSNAFETVSGTGSSITLTAMFAGNDCLCFNYKVFDEFLSIAQIRREKTSIIPKAGKLNAWTPLRGSLKDLSGRGRDWSVFSGTPVAVADEPPIPWDADAVRVVTRALRYFPPQAVMPGQFDPELIPLGWF